MLGRVNDWGRRPRENPHGLAALEDLARGEARGELKIGLAHPQNSALGKRTDDLLRRFDLRDKVP